jgi:hypothetical protein
MIDEVVNNINDACQELGEVELSGIALEKADYRLLDVSHMELDKHVAMQPAAIAFYGAMLKDASRRLGVMKRQFDRWSKKKWAEAKVSCQSGTGKSTVADVEARFIVDNEKELNNWDVKIDKLQMQYDTLNAWFEAWRQKGFSIREYAGITEDERYHTSSSFSGDNNFTKSSDKQKGISKVRSIIKKNREATT